MRDLSAYAKRCMEDLDAIGIKYGNVLAFTANTRAKNRWGQCRTVPGGYTININASLLDERNPEEGLIDTIFHELLHTCKGCMNHGVEWKKMADKVNRAYGLNIKRANSAEEKGVADETRPGMVRHRFVCVGCGAVVNRQRESQFTKHYKDYRCSRCHSEFRKVF